MSYPLLPPDVNRLRSTTLDNKKPAKPLTVRVLWTSLDCFVLSFGRHDWTRTNDPLDVDQVL